jgi:DNA polymerase-3 subunit alpha
VLDGHPEPSQIIDKAVALGRSAVALTDHGSISGHVLFEKAVKGVRQTTRFSHTTTVGEAVDIKPIYGMEAYAVDDVSLHTDAQRAKYHISLLAKNPVGYRNLMKLTTRSWQEGFYYRQSIDGSMLLDHQDGLIVLSGCEKGSFMGKLAAGDYAGALGLARNMQAAFGGDFYVELQHFPHMAQKDALAWAIAQELGIKAVAGHF